METSLDEVCTRTHEALNAYFGNKPMPNQVDQLSTSSDNSEATDRSNGIRGPLNQHLPAMNPVANVAPTQAGRKRNNPSVPLESNKSARTLTRNTAVNGAIDLQPLQPQEQAVDPTILFPQRLRSPPGLIADYSGENRDNFPSLADTVDLINSEVAQYDENKYGKEFSKVYFTSQYMQRIIAYFEDPKGSKATAQEKDGWKKGYSTTNGILYKHVSPRKCGRKSSESSENDAMQNREYLVPRECYFLLAIFCHSECGHRGRDPTVEVMRRHKLHGPPKDFINKWIDLCPTCKAKPGQKNSRKPRTGKMAAKPKPVTAIKRSRARRTTDTSAPSSIPVAVANPTQPINLVGEAEAAPAAETNTAPLENTDYVDDQRFNHPPYGTVNPTQSTGLAGEFKAASVAKTDLVEARSLRHEGKECYIPIWLLTPPNPLNATSNSSQLPGIAEQAPPVYGAQLPQPANPQVNPAPAWTAPPTVSTLTMNAPEQPPAAEFSELFNSSSGPEDWDDDASFQKWYESHETEEQVSKNTGVALFAPSTTAAPQTTSRPSILDAVPAIPIPPTTQNVYVPSSLVDWSIWPVPQVPDWNELPAEGLAQPPFNDGTTMNGDSLGPLNTFSMPAQPAMNGFEQLAMNSFQQPAMNDFQQPAMNDFQQPAMDYFEPPSRNGWQQPATNNFGQLSMNGFQQPSMNNFGQPSMNNSQQPSMNNFQQPSTNNFQQPSMNNFEPRPINPGAAANKDPFQTLPIDFDILAQQHPIPEDSSDLQEQGIEWDRTLFPDDPWLFP